MKKLMRVMLALLLVFTLSGCASDNNKDDGKTTNNDNKNQSTTSDNKTTWPSKDYILKGTEYKGAGEILYVNTTEVENIKQVAIYIKNATLDDVLAYIEQLHGLGIIYQSTGDTDPEPTGIDLGVLFWKGAVADNSFGVVFSFYEETEELSFVDGAVYNLEIHLQNYNLYE